jgi:hypothetical protein
VNRHLYAYILLPSIPGARGEDVVNRR